MAGVRAEHAAGSGLTTTKAPANPRFLQGIDCLCLDPNRVPRLEEVNHFLSPGEPAVSEPDLRSFLEASRGK